MIKYLSLFSGIEAVSASVHRFRLPYECVGFSEIDPDACKVLETLYPRIPNHGDATKLAGRRFRNVDLVIGGSPCIDFTKIGKRRGLAGEHGKMIYEFTRIVRESDCGFFIFENVIGVVDIQEVFQNELAGYELGFYRICPKRNLGLAMPRPRLFVIGVKRNRFDSLKSFCPEQKRQGKIKRPYYNFGFTHVSSSKFGENFISIIPTLLSSWAKKGKTILHRGNESFLPKAEFWEIMFGFPIGYTSAINLDYRRRILLGNSMSVDVMGYILRHFGNYA
jgi:DNA-cytosine methyltransferase